MMERSLVCEDTRVPTRPLKKAQMQGGVTHPGRMGTRGHVRRTPGTPQRVPERANPPEADRWAVFSGLLPDGDIVGEYAMHGAGLVPHK